jgi:hypothetical protein
MILLSTGEWIFEGAIGGDYQCGMNILGRFSKRW